MTDQNVSAAIQAAWLAKEPWLALAIAQQSGLGATCICCGTLRRIGNAYNLVDAIRVNLTCPKCPEAHLSVSKFYPGQFGSPTSRRVRPWHQIYTIFEDNCLWVCSATSETFVTYNHYWYPTPSHDAKFDCISLDIRPDLAREFEWPGHENLMNP